MNIRHASSHLATRFHQPMRFGRFWRGHELPLRMIQIALLLFLGVVGAQWIARAVRLVATSFT